MAVGLAVGALLAVLAHRELLDLEVYRAAGRTWLAGASLYAPDFPGAAGGPALPFTYPPLAAVLLSPLALLPDDAAVVALTLAGVAALGVLLSALWWRPAASSPRDAVAPGGSPAPSPRDALRSRVLAAVVVGALAAAAVSEPVVTTLLLGQVNLVLAALVVADLLLPRTPWPRGLLVGLAAAVKLTPAVFVLVLLVRGDRRGAAVAVGSAAGATLLGAVLAPRDSARYWFGALLDPARVGGLGDARNQSLRGLLHRLPLPGGVETGLWVALAAGVLGLGVLAARRAHHRGREPEAVLAVALTGLLVSPVSWTHHWVWLAVAVAVLAQRWARRPGWTAGVALLGTATLAVLGPSRWLPAGDATGWGAAEQVAGAALVLWGVAVLLVLAAAPCRD